MAFSGPLREHTSAGAAARTYATLNGFVLRQKLKKRRRCGRNAALYAERACIPVEEANTTFASVFATAYLAFEMTLKACLIPTARNALFHTQLCPFLDLETAITAGRSPLDALTWRRGRRIHVDCENRYANSSERLLRQQRKVRGDSSENREGQR